ncbi:MAG: putative nucleotidyltransferase [Candidatus Latescibacterota bacterium]
MWFPYDLLWRKAMETKIQRIIETLRKQLETFYGDRLAHLVLFGSRARGDAEPDSDIDLLVVLHGPVSAGTEIERTSFIVSDLCLENDVVIGCIFMDNDRYEHKNGPLLRNIRKEGILV